MDDPFAVHFRKAAPGLRPDRRKLHRSTPQDTWKRSVIGEILHNLQSIIPTTTPTTNRPHFCRPRRELLAEHFDSGAGRGPQVNADLQFDCVTVQLWERADLSIAQCDVVDSVMFAP